jgi:hypothetical protein
MTLGVFASRRSSSFPSEKRTERGERSTLIAGGSYGPRAVTEGEIARMYADLTRRWKHACPDTKLEGV